MFGGEFRHGIDQKNRLFIPSKLREDLGATFVVAKDIREKCLKVYSQKGWEEYLAPIREQNRRLKEKVMRYLNATMVQVSPDSQGRITLPKELTDYAEIDRTAVVVGCCDYAEIWAEEVYDKMRSEEDVSALLAELEELGL